jgi:hypothetical protein
VAGYRGDTFEWHLGIYTHTYIRIYIHTYIHIWDYWRGSDRAGTTSYIDLFFKVNFVVLVTAKDLWDCSRGFKV